MISPNRAENPQAIDALSGFPLKGVATTIPGARLLTISRYPHSTFYSLEACSLEADSIAIVHIRHGSRRPWRDGED